MPNRFRNQIMRQHYDAIVGMYHTKHRTLFHEGERTMGNGMASFFWRGFDGTQFGAGFTDRASKDTLAYAYYRAGQDMKAEADKCAARTTSQP